MSSAAGFNKNNINVVSGLWIFFSLDKSKYLFLIWNFMDNFTIIVCIISVCGYFFTTVQNLVGVPFFSISFY